MIVNLVAMDMLKARIPPVKSIPRDPIPNGGTSIPNGGVLLSAPIPVNGHTNGVAHFNGNNNMSSMNGTSNGTTAPDIRNRPKIPLPDDDPYTHVGGGGKIISTNNKPPKLPPRDLNIPKPDYDDTMEDEEPRIKPFLNSSRTSAKDKPKGKDRKYDDPYYCGLRARIPAFVQNALSPRNNKKPEGGIIMERETRNGYGGPHPQHHGPPPIRDPRYSAPVPGHPMMWHAKSVDSGMASIHSNPYADPLSIRKMNGNGNSDKYSWNHAFESEKDESGWENYWQS
jgi:hypothetical protein